MGLILGIIGSSVLFVSCGETNGKNGEEILTLNEGAIIKVEKGEFYNLNFEEEKFEKTLKEETILEYNKSKDTYIFLKDGKHFIRRKDKRIEIKDKEYSELKLSPTGKYVAYIIEDSGERILKVLDLDKNTEREIKSKVRISGNFFQFLENDILIYYGISIEGENGLFTYDLEKEAENKFYEIKKGYIEFLKVVDDKIIILNTFDEEEKKLEIITKEGKQSKIIENEIDKIYDIKKIENEYYFLGSIKTDGESLYKIVDDEIERMIFDFPKNIFLEKGLSKTENEEILFMGNEGFESEMKIFSYKNEEVSVVEETDGEYEFIRFK